MKKEYMRARKDAVKATVRAYKRKPCQDCGNSYPYYVMDCDHRPDEEKLYQVAQIHKNQHTLAKVQAELDKCDVICANCHRMRTYERGQYDAHN